MKKLVLVLALAATPAIAANPPWSIGLQGGPSDIDGESSFALGLNGSFQFHPFLAAEVGYMKQGDYSANGSLKGNPYKYQMDFSSFYAAVKPTFYSGSMRYYAKLGISRNKLETSGNLNGVDVGNEETEMKAMFGLGADYFITNQFSLGGNWHSHPIGDVAMNSINFTASYNF